MVRANVNLVGLDSEDVLIKKRIFLASLVLLFCVCLLLSRLIYLQVVRYEHFMTLSEFNHLKIVPIPPIRGLIFSSDDVLLADNRPAFNLEVIPEDIQDLDETLSRLGEIVELSEAQIRHFKERLQYKSSHESVPLRFNLSEAEVAVFSVNRQHFKGINVIARLERYYPLTDELAHILGYVSRIDTRDMSRLDQINYKGSTHTGKLGLERSYEAVLHGEVGYQQVEVNAVGRVIRVLDRTAPRAGSDLYLTLNISLQKIAVEALAGKQGAIVVLEPNTGGILAAVSAPGYDPNPFVNGIDSRAYNSLLSSKQNPLINRVIQGVYSPGSTIKPFLGFIALESGLRARTDTLRCPGSYSLKGQSKIYYDWKKEGHGHIDLEQAIMQSCDVYFYTLAHDLGIDRIHDGLKGFGFGSLAGVDIPGESSGLLPSVAWKAKARGQPWFPGETIIAGIGQGYMLATPLQLARATAALVNGGKLVQPRLVAWIDHVDRHQREPLSTLVEGTVPIRDPANLAFIIRSMRNVVHGERGTAWSSGRGAAYEFAGKTGTVQLIKIDHTEGQKKEIPKHLQDHALFIAFAPVDNPLIVVAIIVENGGSGSKVAAPIARKLFDHYLLDQAHLSAVH